jgi:O-antigen/teichoic acid export membrane protein
VVSQKKSVSLRSALFSSVGAKLAITAGTVLLAITLGRIYGAEGYGVFSLAMSILLVCNVFANYGLDRTLFKQAGVWGASSKVRLVLRQFLPRVFIIAWILALGMILARHLLAQLLNSEDLDQLIVPLAISLPAFAVSFSMAGLFKGLRKPALGLMLQNGAISLLTAVFMLSMLSIGLVVSLTGAVWLFCVAAWAILGFGVLNAFKALPKENSTFPGQPPADVSVVADVRSSNNAFFAIQVASLLQTSVLLLVGGMFLFPAEIGQFKVAERATLLISLTLGVLNAILPGRFAQAAAKGDLHEFARLARFGATIASLCAIPVLVLFVFGGDAVLRVFGEEFGEAKVLLLVVAVGQTINVVTGSVSMALGMSGLHTLIRNVVIMSALVSLLLVFPLISLFGVMGLALAHTISVCLTNLVGIWFVRDRLGFWLVPLSPGEFIRACLNYR